MTAESAERHGTNVEEKERVSAPREEGESTPVFFFFARFLPAAPPERERAPPAPPFSRSLRLC